MVPVHPTYGTLDQLLSEIRETVSRGQIARIGHIGALAWFSSMYGGQTPLAPGPVGSEQIAEQALHLAGSSPCSDAADALPELKRKYHAH